MPDNRDRATLQTQLVKDKKLDREIIDYYEQQVRYREWLNSFRKAFELHMSLESGNTDVLKRMYPDLWAMLKTEAREYARAVQQSIEEAKEMNRGLEENDGARNYEKLKIALGKLKD